MCPYDLRVPGGVQAHVADLADRLGAEGGEVVVLGPGADVLPRGRDLGGTVGVPVNDSVAPIALHPRTAWRTAASVTALRPDLVHVHEPLVPLVSLTAVLRSAAPVVGTYHAWSDRSRAYRLARPVTRRVHDHLAAAVTVSPAAQRFHAEALGLPARALPVVPNGVDVEAHASARPEPRLTGDGRQRMLFLGRLEPRKGLAELIRAFARLKIDRPALELLVAGEGPERRRCERLLPTRLRADVTFLGYVVDERKRRLLRSCDVLAAPALGGESFGMVLVEAMAAGLPVVASDIPGYATVITDGRDGRLVPPGDVGALARALDALLGNPALAAAMAEEGRRTVRAYDWSVVVGQLRAVYERALARA